MDFDRTDDQKLLAKTVAEFAKKDSTVERFRRLRNAEGEGFDRSVWARMGELGWLAVPFAEELGGFGGSMVDVGLVLEELGKSLVPEPYLPCVVLAGSALRLAGSAAQQERWLEALLAGERVLAFAHAERTARYAPEPRETWARADGEGYVLSGTKVFVLAGHAAEAFVVSARLGDAPALDTAGYIAIRRAGLGPELLASFDEALAASPPSHPFRYVLNALLVGPLFPLLIALFTELGFRGFLFREVQGGFWRRSLLIGLAEAAFLAPLGAFGYQFPGTPLLGAGLLAAWALLASPALVYLRVRSGSVIAVALFRGTLFAMTTIAADLSGAAPALRPFFGAAGLVALALLLLGLFVHDWRFADVRLMGAGLQKAPSSP